jgi:hypothetical protein
VESKVLSKELIDSLFQKFNERASSTRQAKPPKEKVPLEQKIAKSREKSFSVLHHCIFTRILPYAAFLLEYSEAIQETQDNRSSNNMKDNWKKYFEEPKAKKEIKKSYQFTASEFVISIVSNDLLLQDRTLFFFSSMIEEYTTRIMPILLLT